METEVKAIERNGAFITMTLGAIPDTCPRCHRSLIPRIGQTFVHVKSLWAQAVFQCTSDSCAEIFIGNYKCTSPHVSRVFALGHVTPVNAVKQVFANGIFELSPSFVEIFNQAIAAEAQGLSQLVGIGLRKAVEFLIKDFAIHQNPADVEKIKSLMLGPCISAYVTDQNVKDCAKRAAWFGNDETHYIRKWEAQDITDLKLLVRLTTNWVENVLLTQKYVAEMPQPTQ